VVASASKSTVVASASKSTVVASASKSTVVASASVTTAVPVAVVSSTNALPSSSLIVGYKWAKSILKDEFRSISQSDETRKSRGSGRGGNEQGSEQGSGDNDNGGSSDSGSGGGSSHSTITAARNLMLSRRQGQLKPLVIPSSGTMAECMRFDDLLVPGDSDTVIIPHAEQLEAFRLSLLWNHIVVLPTGYGKTLIACLVIHRMVLLNPGINNVSLTFHRPFKVTLATRIEQ
jgi:hypothetical protein